MKCGLLGRHLSHSYSPEIHGKLSDYSYDLFEVEPDSLEDFLTQGDFDGLNVTVPYKKAVMPYLAEISPRAEAIGAVNTVKKLSDGRLYGDNTDYCGLEYMLSSAQIDLWGKKVLILGSGGASATAQALVRDKNAAEIVVISRSGENNYGNISRHRDAHIIINTTPVGMYPNNGESPLSLDAFEHLEAVADVIYNPAKTAFIMDAEARGIKAVSGLSMLVAQAKSAAEIFTGEHIDDSRVEEITWELSRQMKNIVLVGMPGVGKSTIGRTLAEMTGREFLDTDAEILRRAGMPIPDIFARFGEDYFRDLESAVVLDLTKLSGKVIATGGGAILREDNKRAIRQNSVAVFLKRDLDTLSKDGRPISQRSDLHELYAARLPHYEAVAEVVSEVAENPTASAKLILEAMK